MDAGAASSPVQSSRAAADPSAMVAGIGVTVATARGYLRDLRRDLRDELNAGDRSETAGALLPSSEIGSEIGGACQLPMAMTPPPKTPPRGGVPAYASSDCGCDNPGAASWPLVDIIAPPRFPTTVHSALSPSAAFASASLANDPSAGELSAHPAQPLQFPANPLQSPSNLSRSPKAAVQESPNSISASHGAMAARRAASGHKA